MKRAILTLLLAAGLAATAGTAAHAYNLPPMNLGLTDILDGALPGPGTYFTQYVQGYRSDEFKDDNGNEMPDVGSLLVMSQFVHVYGHKVAGGHLGADLLLPVVGISGGDNFSTNPGYLGDLTVGPFLQWFDTKLMGRPFLQRIELDVSLPTGQYGKKYALNPGSNLWVIEPYYAFTWFLTPEFSTSWRLHYTYSTKNDDTEVKPGDAFHANYSFEYAFTKNFRGAVAGYYLKQLSEDDCPAGAPAAVCGPEEETVAIGPAVHWIASEHFSMGLKVQMETGTEHRPEGNRTTFRWTYKF